MQVPKSPNVRMYLPTRAQADVECDGASRAIAGVQIFLLD